MKTETSFPVTFGPIATTPVTSEGDASSVQATISTLSQFSALAVAPGPPHDWVAIADADNQQAQYRLGDAVMPGARIVVIDAEGATVAAFDRSFRLSIGEISSARASETDAKPERLGEVALKNARFVPEMRAGKTSGFSVRVNGSPIRLSQSGLRDGDIVLAIDDVPVVSEEHIRSILRRQSTVPPRFTVDRSGIEMTAGG